VKTPEEVKNAIVKSVKPSGVADNRYQKNIFPVNNTLKSVKLFQSTLYSLLKLKMNRFQKEWGWGGHRKQFLISK
jgi:hypothetical protein